MPAPLSVAYDPFLTSPAEAKAWASAGLKGHQVFDTSANVGLSTLWKAVDELVYFVAPGIHSNSFGRVFHGVSFYTTDPEPDARCVLGPDDLVLTSVSVGLVRQFTVIAVEFYTAALWATANEEIDLSLIGEYDIRSILTGHTNVSQDYLDRFLDAYPLAPGHSDPKLSMLFGDMLRFVWMHEWSHGLAGHLHLAGERLGAFLLREAPVELDLPEPSLLIARALEFEADSVAIAYLLNQVLCCEDQTGQSVKYVGSMQERIIWFVFSVSIVINYWSELEQSWTPLKMRHPSARFRMTNLLDTVRAIVSQNGMADVSVAIDTFVNAIYSKMARKTGMFKWVLTQLPGFFELPDVRQARLEADAYIEELKRHPFEHWRITHDRVGWRREDLMFGDAL